MRGVSFFRDFLSWHSPLQLPRLPRFLPQSSFTRHLFRFSSYLSFLSPLSPSPPPSPVSHYLPPHHPTPITPHHTTLTQGFAVYEIGGGQADRYLRPDECMLDFEAAKRPGGAARFLFKKRIFHTLTAPLSSDPLALSLIYHQVCVCVVFLVFVIWDSETNIFCVDVFDSSEYCDSKNSDPAVCLCSSCLSCSLSTSILVLCPSLYVLIASLTTNLSITHYHYHHPSHHCHHAHRSTTTCRPATSFSSSRIASARTQWRRSSRPSASP